ncbi:MAG: ABC transporter ATP-binding protein [Rickettsiales bacterium]|jgi:ABC-type lipoprotein export system ATPase subunit|nr:ABC transporter ATP-binding protein [Rickettsiales bacterium]
MIELKDITYQPADKPVLNHLNLTIKRGEHTLLLGASGSGKTTLLHLIAGLLSPTSGEVRVDGELVSSLLTDASDAWRARSIGMVFQTLHLFPMLDVLGNLQLARYLAGLKPDDARLMRLLEEVGLGEKAHALPSALSQGQAQRVAIARALATGAPWLLADEPTSALDDDNTRSIMDLLEVTAREHQATLLIATHDQRIAGRLPKRIALGQMKLKEVA